MKRLLIVGFGDIAKRALPALRAQFEVSALVRAESMREAAQHGGLALMTGDLDEPRSLGCLGAGAELVAHFAPPPVRGTTDPRTASLLAALEPCTRPPERIVYISTSGVYGNCDNALIDESRLVNPQSDRARRRVDAENQLVRFGATHGTRIVILRTPGIYAADRLPIERLRQRTPVLRGEDDVYTNHIHADDLAALVLTALTHPDARGVYNASDDSALRMGEWFDLIAARAGLAAPPRIARAEAAKQIPAPLLSFMSESRRLVNTRIKDELGFRLRYPTVRDGVPARITLPAR
jgi:nucleoside-diphosphate-sugar epimerase